MMRKTPNDQVGQRLVSSGVAFTAAAIPYAVYLAVSPETGFGKIFATLLTLGLGIRFILVLRRYVIHNKGSANQPKDHNISQRERDNEVPDAKNNESGSEDNK